MSCKHFNLQRALYAGVLEAAAFFFDAQEESLGPVRDAPLHRVLIHLGPRDGDSGFHLHLVLGLACEALLQHIVDLVLPSRPDVVIERVEIWRICREPWREQCRRGRPVRCITAPISCHGGAVAGRPVLLHDEIHANLRCRLRDVVMSQQPVVFRRCHLHGGRHKNSAPRLHRPMWHQQQPWCLFMNLSPSRATMLGLKFELCSESTRISRPNRPRTDVGLSVCLPPSCPRRLHALETPAARGYPIRHA